MTTRIRHKFVHRSTRQCGLMAFYPHDPEFLGEVVRSEWSGSLAPSLGLAGAADPGIALDLCHGYEPGGIHRYLAKRGSVVGLRTIIAPDKSFAALAGLTDEYDVILMDSAHNLITNGERVIGRRLPKGRTKVFRHTGIIVGRVTLHELNNGGEWNKHAHVDWFLLTYDKKRMRRCVADTIALRHGFGGLGRLVHCDMLFGLQTAGLQPAAEGNFFPFSGVDLDQISTRRNQILFHESLAADRVAPEISQDPKWLYRTRDQATYATRHAKAPLDRAEVDRTMVERLGQTSLDRLTLIEDAHRRLRRHCFQPATPNEIAAATVEALYHAHEAGIRHLNRLVLGAYVCELVKFSAASVTVLDVGDDIALAAKDDPYPTRVDVRTSIARLKSSPRVQSPKPSTTFTPIDVLGWGHGQKERPQIPPAPAVDTASLASVAVAMTLESRKRRAPQLVLKDASPRVASECNTRLRQHALDLGLVEPNGIPVTLCRVVGHSQYSRALEVKSGQRIRIVRGADKFRNGTVWSVTVDGKVPFLTEITNPSSNAVHLPIEASARTATLDSDFFGAKVGYVLEEPMRAEVAIGDRLRPVCKLRVRCGRRLPTAHPTSVYCVTAVGKDSVDLEGLGTVKRKDLADFGYGWCVPDKWRTTGPKITLPFADFIAAEKRLAPEIANGKAHQQVAAAQEEYRERLHLFQAAPTLPSPETASPAAQAVVAPAPTPDEGNTSCDLEPAPVLEFPTPLEKPEHPPEDAPPPVTAAKAAALSVDPSASIIVQSFRIATRVSQSAKPQPPLPPNPVVDAPVASPPLPVVGPATTAEEPVIASFVGFAPDDAVEPALSPAVEIDI